MINHIYQIILNSDQPFQRKVFKAAINHDPWRPYFLTDQSCFSYFFLGECLVNVPCEMKYQSSMSSIVFNCDKKFQRSR